MLYEVGLASLKDVVQFLLCFCPSQTLHVILTSEHFNPRPVCSGHPVDTPCPLGISLASQTVPSSLHSPELRHFPNLWPFMVVFSQVTWLNRCEQVSRL